MTNLPMDSRIPPQSMPAEQAALGAMLLERDAIIRALECLAPADFYREAHRTIFTGIAELHRQGKPADIITLGEWLKVRDLLDAVGGTLYLTTLMCQCPTAAGIGHYAGIIRARAAARAVIRDCDTLAQNAYADHDIDKLLAEAEECIAKTRAIAERGGTVDLASQRIGLHMKSSFYAMEDANATGDAEGLFSNLGSLNGLLMPGLQRGTVTVLAGVTSGGKTLSAMHTFGIPNAELGNRVLALSCEMRQIAVARRALVALSDRVPSYWLDNANVRRDKWDRDIAPDLARVIERAWDWPLFLLYEPGLTPARLYALIRQCQREQGGCDLVIIDGLWLMRPDRPCGSRMETVSTLMHDVYEIAGRTQVPILLLHQLSRPDKSQNLAKWRPTNHHLKESGDVENDADLVLFVHPPDYFSPERQAVEPLEFILAKNRVSGRLGVTHAMLNRNYGRITETAEEYNV